MFESLYMLTKLDLSSASMAAAETAGAAATSTSVLVTNHAPHYMKRGHGRSLLASSHSNKKAANPTPPAPALSCRRSSTMAVIDVAVLLAVFAACGYLALPYIQLLCTCLAAALGSTVRDLDGASMAVKLVGAGIVLLGIIAFIVLSTRCTAFGRRCDNPNCLGLRDAPEFDVKIETEEEAIQNAWLGSVTGRSDSTDDGFFELSGDRHKELEAELKKVAPVNGRVVLVFRARCGCSAGKMVVMGPKKTRKIRK